MNFSCFCIWLCDEARTETCCGLQVISERESLGDGFYKLHLLRALRRTYPAEKITWIVSESDSPYRTTMARIADPYLDKLIVNAGLRRPGHAA